MMFMNLAESTYTYIIELGRKLKNIFHKFEYTIEKQDKIYKLFFDHDINLIVLIKTLIIILLKYN